MAALMGVNVGTIYMATFALGSGLAAVAGALLGPIFLVNPTMGDLASLKAFAIVILGGLGSTVGATIGGFAIALIEEFGAGYISADYRDAFSFLVIVAVLHLQASRPVHPEGAGGLMQWIIGLLGVLVFATLPFWMNDPIHSGPVDPDRHFHRRRH